MVVMVNPQSQVTSELTTYLADLTIQNEILQGGYLLITFPLDVRLEDPQPQCLFNNLKTACSLISKEGA